MKRCPICDKRITRGRCHCRQRQRAYLPTPEEIAEGCRKIQAEWSEEVEMERRVIKNRQPDYGRVVRTGEQGPS